MARWKPSTVGALVVLALLASASPVTAQARLALRDGRVYLSASDVPLHDLLTLWEAQTGTKILFGDRLPNEPMTVDLQGVSERDALDLLLRTAVGYVARHREGTVGPGQSQLAVLLVLAESHVLDGTAARQAIEKALEEQRAAAPLVDYRDLPPRDPSDPNGPVGLTPASPGDVDPPPFGLPEGEGSGAPAGSDPAVNPIPANLPPPPAPTSAPTPADAMDSFGRSPKP